MAATCYGRVVGNPGRQECYPCHVVVLKPQLPRWTVTATAIQTPRDTVGYARGAYLKRVCAAADSSTGPEAGHKNGSDEAAGVVQQPHYHYQPHHDGPGPAPSRDGRSPRQEPRWAPASIPAESVDHNKHISFLTAPMSATPRRGAVKPPKPPVPKPTLKSIPEEVTKGGRYVSLLTAPWAAPPSGVGLRGREDGAQPGSSSNNSSGDSNTSSGSSSQPAAGRSWPEEPGPSQPLVGGPGFAGPGSSAGGGGRAAGRSAHLFRPVSASSAGADGLVGEDGLLQGGGGSGGGDRFYEGGGGGGGGGWGGQGSSGPSSNGEQLPSWAWILLLLFGLAVGMAVATEGRLPLTWGRAALKQGRTWVQGKVGSAVG